jgi:hypothetical protein
MADFNLAVADADQYRLMVAGAPISNGAGASGYADGEFFKSSLKNDGFIVIEGSDGSVARSKRLTRLVDLEITLLQTSTSNAYLSMLYNLDQNQPNGAGIGSFVLEDLQGTTLVICTRAWVNKPADIQLDRGATARKWPLVGLYSVYLVGGN